VTFGDLLGTAAQNYATANGYRLVVYSNILPPITVYTAGAADGAAAGGGLIQGSAALLDADGATVATFGQAPPFNPAVAVLIFGTVAVALVLLLRGLVRQ
jgi:hypothetical protein